MNPISFEATPQELRAANEVARRFRDAQRKAGLKQDRKQLIVMDLLAANANGCPLDFDKLLSAPITELVHDVAGIAHHLDRDDESPTGGQLLRHFRPKCARGSS